MSKVKVTVSNNTTGKIKKIRESPDSTDCVTHYYIGNKPDQTVDIKMGKKFSISIHT